MYVLDYLFYFVFQESEILTVFAKDGDVESPNPIVYSVESGMYQLLYIK